MSKAEKKEERVKLYNRGRRDWDLKDIGEMVRFEKGTHRDFNKSAAEKLIKNYPKDFILAGDMPSKEDTARLKKENKALKGQIETAKGGLEKLEELREQWRTVQDKNVALDEENTELKGTIDQIGEKTVKLENTLEELKTAIELKDQEIEDFKTRVEDLENRLSAALPLDKEADKGGN